MKDQTIGIEIEMTGITRARAAEVAAAFLDGTIEKTYDSYDTHARGLSGRPIGYDYHEKRLPFWQKYRGLFE